MTKVFIDGGEGTTGLRILERFEVRDDVELIKIDPELRKDPEERRKMINSSDITFLCLPDAAAIEAVSLVDPDNKHTVIIDASTAHRTEPGWAYGLPELGKDFREKIASGNRIAVPGCYASGFNMLVYPLVKQGIIAPDYPVYVTALSGYSGAGKKAIALYESEDKTEDLYAPREYALSQSHKHLKEMKAISGLAREPLFTPVVDDYYCGMIVSLPLFAHLMEKKETPEELHKIYADYYKEEQFITVMPFGSEAEGNNFFAANAYAGRDDAQIYITGNDDRLLVTSRFDNLGKGASGAAIQCMNIKLGIPQDTGLNL
ncbi:MAG: N-acetyl-gamma-glutamyl-phosphate reductase [Lachnospiraceae bacterium]|nr:N-acetyl-gamma-glutamyl-phosphate reductase [Candidatus Colinaster scatohippi]